MDWFGFNVQSRNFQMFSASHLVALAIFVLFTTVIYLFREKLKEDKWRRIEIGVNISLIFIEIANQVWMYVHGVWKPGRSLPLELCNIGLLLCIVLLWTRKKTVFELIFFIAVLGATQAIVTPAITYDFPHFRFFHFFYAHMMVVWVSLYFMWAKGYYPTFRSVIKLIIFINMFLPVILFVNKQTDGNYWFLRHKPESRSLLDILGPYPYYIFSLESLLIVFSFITWLFVRKWRNSISKRAYAD